MNIRSLLCLGTMAALLAACAPRASDSADTPPSGAAQLIQFKTNRPADYQCFLGNWDDAAQPALLAQVRTAAQFATLFHPAPVMGGNKPFGPEDSVFKTEQLLVVGRSVDNADDINKALEVVSVAAKEGVLTFSYRFTTSAQKSGATFGAWLGVRVHQGDYRKVVFLENGKLVGELNAAGGEWVLPASAAKAGQ